MNKANECTCPSGDGSLVHPCPAHPAVEQADVAAKLTFINGRPAMCGCQVEYSDGGGEYSDVIYVTLCAKHSGSAILDLVATNRIALTPEYEGQWHADLYLDREIPLAKVEGATPAEAVLALMSAERIDPEQESVEQAGGDEHVSLRGAANLAFNALHECVPAGGAEKQYSDAIRALETALRDIAYSVNRTATPQQFSDHLQREARAALAQPSPAQAEQAEAERPEMSPERAAYFMRRFKSEEKLLGPNEQAAVDYVLSLLAQHDRIVGELRAEIAEWQEAAGRSRSDVVAYIAERAKLLEERDAALANVDALTQGNKQLRAELEALRARVVVLPDRLPRREDQSESAQEGRRWGMSEVREVFEKRMAGIFDLSAYVDSQGDIRYSDSHTQAAWDGCQLVVDLFEPAPSVRQGMSLDHIGRLHALEKLRLRIAAHMFIRKNGELLGYGVTVPEMREFRELLIPFNGEIK